MEFSRVMTGKMKRRGKGLGIIILAVSLFLGVPGANGQAVPGVTGQAGLTAVGAGSVDSAAKGTGNSERELMHEIGSWWLMIGARQVERGYYNQAEDSVGKIGEGKVFFGEEESRLLANVLVRLKEVRVERRGLAEHISAAKELINNGDPIRAKAHLKAVRGNELLSAKEKQIVERALKEVDRQIAELRELMGILYEQSVGFYNNGDYEKAREGFAKVAESGLVASGKGESAEDYLIRIEKAERDSYSGVGFRTKREADFWRQSSGEKGMVGELEEIEDSLYVSAGARDKGEMIEAAKPFDDGSEAGGDEVLGAAGQEVTSVGGEPGEQTDEARVSIVRMYVKAVVDDAIRKAAGFLSEGQYKKAQEAVKGAEAIVEAKRELTGEIVYQQNKSRLSQVNELIVSEQVRHLDGG